MDRGCQAVNRQCCVPHRSLVMPTKPDAIANPIVIGNRADADAHALPPLNLATVPIS